MARIRQDVETPQAINLNGMCEAFGVTPKPRPQGIRCKDLLTLSSGQGALALVARAGDVYRFLIVNCALHR
ncbi:hypothetical protein [Chelatococcus asaccharovorans]|uniref:hypothetical protein n=1 Tax=Chelatococcus asaccharovorans TaxID=28210 RepID=UPI0011B44081|nr:hypothetical protein [Chelatococcus asaccharovorans]MBS7704800.1 hypothetical protein [Chelatococcus asaccharovorans]